MLQRLAALKKEKQPHHRLVCCTLRSGDDVIVEAQKRVRQVTHSKTAVMCQMFRFLSYFSSRPPV